MCKIICWTPRIFAGLLELLFKGAQLATVSKMLSFVPAFTVQIFCSMIDKRISQVDHGFGQVKLKTLKYICYFSIKHAKSKNKY
jgi:hypothetical protein